MFLSESLLDDVEVRVELITVIVRACIGGDIVMIVNG